MADAAPRTLLQTRACPNCESGVHVTPLLELTPW